MKISAEQVVLLLLIAKDTLSENLARINFGGMPVKERNKLVSEIIGQQDKTLVDLDSPEIKKILQGRKLNIEKEE